MWLWIGTALVASLRIAFIWSDEGIYPGLPADFIPVDILVFAFGGAAALVLTVAIIARLAGRAALFRRARALSALCVAPALVLAPDIVGRQLGPWARLRGELVEYDQKVASYIREHGPVQTEEQARALVKVYPSPQFAFSASGPEVRIVYRWYWGVDNARVLIVWGHGASAAFDLQTMICDYVD